MLERSEECRERVVKSRGGGKGLGKRFKQDGGLSIEVFTKFNFKNYNLFGMHEIKRKKSRKK